MRFPSPPEARWSPTELRGSKGTAGTAPSVLSIYNVKPASAAVKLSCWLLGCWVTGLLGTDCKVHSVKNLAGVLCWGAALGSLHNDDETPRGPPRRRPPHRTATPRSNHVSRSGACLSRPGTRVSRPGIRASRSGIRVSRPGTRVSQPGTRVSRPGTRASRSGTRVSRSGTHVSRSGTRASRPGTRVSRPGIRASRSGIRVSRPGIRVSRPGTRVSRPGTRVSQPGTPSRGIGSAVIPRLPGGPRLDASPPWPAVPTQQPSNSGSPQGAVAPDRDDYLEVAPHGRRWRAPAPNLDEESSPPSPFFLRPSSVALRPSKRGDIRHSLR